MLIRSQNRDAIIPLETCKGIGIKRLFPSRCEINVAMDAETYIVLGEYESHERAQEVLEELLDYYTAMERGYAVIAEIARHKSMFHGCFDMPAE